MENISRALIIAGGMLLTILILSVLVFLFNRISIIPQEQVTQYSEKGIVEYNRSFEVYQKPLMYGTDIISVLNKAVDHNMQNGLLDDKATFFQRSFVDPVSGSMMNIDAIFTSNEQELDFHTRVRIYYHTRTEDNQVREMEYGMDMPIKGYEKNFGEVFSKANYENSENYRKLISSVDSELLKKPFQTQQYSYKINTGAGFFKKNSDGLALSAGLASQDVKTNKELMKFLSSEPITILNPDPEDVAWSKIVIIPPSAKLKKMIFKCEVEETEYYQNGRIKKLVFKER